MKLILPRADTSFVNRFWKYVEKKAGCWLWTGQKLPRGYGMLRVSGAGNGAVYAHRASYALHKGEPGNMLVCHTCDNPACVNPDHLFLGTYLDNARDKCAKGRQCKGANHYARANPELIRRGERRWWNTRLTFAQVQEIRRLAASTTLLQREIGAMFGVNNRTVSSIVRLQKRVHC